MNYKEIEFEKVINEPVVNIAALRKLGKDFKHYDMIVGNEKEVLFVFDLFSIIEFQI